MRSENCNNLLQKNNFFCDLSMSKENNLLLLFQQNRHIEFFEDINAQYGKYGKNK